MSAQDYLSTHFQATEGWLWENAVYTTELLIVAQRDLGIEGVCLEIGVWKGKYLGAMIAIAPERDAYGIDVWLHNQIGSVAQFLKEVSPATTVTLRRANTFDCDVGAMRKAVDNKPVAFASVDGSHEALPVQRDLANVAQLLAPGGIVAIDDFLNPLTLGVTEGVMAFLQSGVAIEPICWSSNKLFVTTAGWRELYQIRLRMWLDGGAARTMLGKESMDWAHHVTHLVGQPVIVF
jgi:SAM-dependent methyltransferase